MAERLLTRKESDEEEPLNSTNRTQKSNNNRRINASGLKFCISWLLIICTVLITVMLIMLFWFDAVERSTIVGKSFTANMFNPTSNDKPVILAWTKFFGDPLINWFNASKQCPYKCIYSDDREKYENIAKVRIFHARDVSSFDLPTTHADSLNVFFTLESPLHTEYKWNLITESLLRKDYFNLTVSYRRDSQIQYPYDVFVPRNPDVDKEGEYYTDEEVEKAIDNKTEMSFIAVSNCRTDSKREVLLKKLREMMPITVVGKCYDKMCDYDKCLPSLERQHHFYLAFENSVCPDYITEKFWRIKNLVVPVVLTRSVVPSTVPSYAFIAVDDFPTLQEFVDYLFKVAKDREMYKSYLAWTKNYRKTYGVNEFSVPGCELCKIAYQQKSYRLRNVEKYLSHNQCKHAYATYLLTDRTNRTWGI